MNKSKIEWCDYTWNPVTGCLHGCEYCYARRIANRFAPAGLGEEDLHGCFASDYKGEAFPHRFAPTFYFNRLNEPSEVKKPSKIFVSSMADLFGDWITDEWIQGVFKACENAPQHKYLFLTKNADRYLKIINNGKIPVRDNYWFGTTITSKDGYAYARGQGINTFASIEPILSEFNGVKAELLPNWVIIGAETGNRKGKVIPQKVWIDNIAKGCEEAGVPIFMKNSLKELMGKDFIQDFPEGLR